MNQQVGILMNNTLAALGLKSLLERQLNITCHLIGHISELQHPAADRHLAFLITDINTYLAQQAYFFPRRNRTIVCDHITPENTDHSLNIVNTAQPLTKITRQLTLLLNANNDGNQTKPQLSGREIDVLRLIASGHINKQIAETLNISINTVLTHRKNITAKLGIKSVSGLTFYAMMNGIVTP